MTDVKPTYNVHRTSQAAESMSSANPQDPDGITKMDAEGQKPAMVTVLSDHAHGPSVSERAWTWRVIVMTMLVSLGGMIFGYGGIGTIGGFLAMEDYKKRFGTEQADVSAFDRYL
jgi:hypothetical protein